MLSMNKFSIRILNLLIGTLLYALGIVFTLKANIGYAPWEVFHVGLSLATGLSIGGAAIIAGIVIVIIVTACGEKIGLGTLCSMIITGVLIDLIIMLDVIPLSENLTVGIMMLVTGFIIISAGSYFYIKSAFGVGPRDNLMVVLKRKTKMPVGIGRSIVELTVTLAGWILGGMVGTGTVISIFGIGLFIQITFVFLKFDPTAVAHETIKQTYKTHRRPFVIFLLLSVVLSSIFYIIFY